MHNRNFYNFKNKGMTLIELVIVLGILAAIASYALTSMDTLTDRTRHDNTLRTMNQLQTAIVGTNTEVSRFVKDMGRIPIIRSSEQGEEFGELISIDYIPANEKSNWKGPYLLTGKTKFFDGFGNAFQIKTRYKDNNNLKLSDWYFADTLPANQQGEIFAIRSLGKDGIETLANNAPWVDKDITMEGFDYQTQATLTIIVKTLSKISSPNDSKWVLPSFRVLASNDSNIYTITDWNKAKVNNLLIIKNGSDANVYRCVYRNPNLPDITHSPNPTLNNSTIGSISTISQSNTIAMKWEYIGNQMPAENLSKLECRIYKSGSTNVLLDIFQENSTDFTGIFDFNKSSNLFAGNYEISIYGELTVIGGITFQVETIRETISLRPGSNVITIYITEPLKK